MGTLALKLSIIRTFFFGPDIIDIDKLTPIIRTFHNSNHYIRSFERSNYGGYTVYPDREEMKGDI